MKKGLKKLNLEIIVFAAVFAIAAGAPVFAQKKTLTISPCVDLKTDKNEAGVQFLTNQDYAPCKQAVESLRAASVIVLDEELTPNDTIGDVLLRERLLKIAVEPV